MPAKRREIVKKARGCHSKAAWRRFFQEEPKLKSRLKNDRLVRKTIFDLLAKDPLSPNYDPGIWIDLIRSCQKAWDQRLAENICHHVEGVYDPELNLAMAETYIEGGRSQRVRKLASRWLKQPGLDTYHRVNFELILSSGYLHEGRSLRADAILEPIDLDAAMEQNSPHRSAFISRNMARLYFSKGDYTNAAMLFERAAEFFKEDKNYNEAALSYYNSAAAYDNAGFRHSAKATKRLNRAIKLATTYQIRVVSSYCYCFRGIVNFQKGDHNTAYANLEMALSSLPEGEQGLRRVAIIGFQCLTKLRLGHHKEARNLYRQRRELCADDPEVAKAARFPLLDAEMLWLDGDWEQAIDVLTQALAPFKDRLITTIDDLALVAKLLTISSYAGIKVNRKRYKISPELQHHRHTWLCYRLALLEQRCLSDEDSDNLREAEELLAQAKEWKSVTAVQGALALLLKLLVKKEQFGQVFDGYRQELYNSLDSHPNSSRSLLLIDIPHTYHSGQFKKAHTLVQEATASDRLTNPVERTVIPALAKTAMGKVSRLGSEMAQKAVDHFSREYLQPRITWDFPRGALLGDSLPIDLSCQATVVRFLSCLADNPTQAVSTAELQQQVWGQSLQQKNWKQKIRNTVSRIRMLFGLALVPVVLQDSNEVRLNHDIMTFTRHVAQDDTDAALIELLRNHELSSTELAKRLHLSRSTAKRKLKKALDSRQIQSNKKGRNIYYSVS